MKVGALTQQNLGKSSWGRCRSKIWAGEGGGAAAAKAGQEKVGALLQRKLGGRR